MSIKSYMDLVVWQKSMDLVVACYGMVRQFPSSEQYGLASQIQRASVSIPSNIAEGHARFHTKEYLHHLSFARGSLAELNTQVQIAGRLNYLSSKDVTETLEKMDEIAKMLNGLRKSLTHTNPNP
jgi:four helix bundle protein